MLLGFLNFIMATSQVFIDNLKKTIVCSTKNYTLNWENFFTT
jgi:hypothetical protein